MPSQHKEYKSRELLGEYQTPKMVLWMLKHSGGMLKTQKQAAAVLLSFILLTLIVVSYLMVRLNTLVGHPLVSAPIPGALSGTRQ